VSSSSASLTLLELDHRLLTLLRLGPPPPLLEQRFLCAPQPLELSEPGLGMGESKSLLPPTSCPAAPASSSGAPPLDLESPRLRGSGGCGEARIGEPAFDPAPLPDPGTVGMVVAVLAASFPSLTRTNPKRKRIRN
jgi:hypothetical protein